MSKKNRILLFVLLLCTTTVLFLLHRPVELVNTLSHLDKFFHFVLFFILTWSMSSALNTSLSLTLLVLLAYGFIIELIQSRIPGLVPDFYDWLADAVGVIAYFSLVLLFKQRKKNAN